MGKLREHSSESFGEDGRFVQLHHRLSFGVGKEVIMNPETILNALYDLWAKEHGETVEIEIVNRKEYET